MRKPFIKIDIKHVLKYFLLVIFTASILLCTFIALPQTEKIFKKQTFNLNINDNSTWEKQFTIKLTFQPTDIVYKSKLINQTKNVIYNRLQKYGVDFVEMSYKDGTDNTGILAVEVKGRNDSANIESIINAQSDIYLVTRKTDANFNDTKDQYAIYNPDNYDVTDLTREYFRTIYITKLKSTSGDYSYFGLFKTFIWKETKFYDFIEKYSGQEAGLYIDGFVSPLTVPTWTDRKNTAKPTLAIGLTSDAKVARVQSIIFNSGKIPLTIEVTDKKDAPVGKIDINTLILSAITVTSILVMLVVKYFLDRKDIFRYTLTIFVITIAGFTFFKLSQAPISLISLLISFPTVFLVTILLEQVKKKLSFALLIVVVIYIFKQLTLGQTSEILSILSISILAFPIFDYLMQRYILLFKQILSR
ncbi:hypothetical protein M0R04_01685 [Candidatus Dojkabacteria bacterium]|jgi:hypothetical protein|nr:hypothetical protein [Candidatus Dojkabacteria bacterium]